MSEAKLTYGLYPSTKRLIHIEDAENGLACGCVCPECGDKLEAVNNGQKRAHHFRHSNGADCPKARMTALHMLAQQVFAEHREICLPDYEIALGKIKRPGEKHFENVILEKAKVLGDKSLRPDCIATNKNQDLWVEFRVTHEVDDQKSASIKKHNIYCAEVDLRSLLDADYTQETIYHFLVNRKDCRSWISCPVWDEERKEALKKIKQEEAEKEQEEIKKKLQEELDAKKFVADWMKSGDREGADKLVQYLNTGVCVANPFDYYNELLQGSIWKYIDRAPKTPYALNVFYQLIIRLKENDIFREVDEHGLRYSLEESLKSKDYYKFSELLMIYILFVTPEQNVNIIKDGDEYSRKYQIGYGRVLENWKHRKMVIEAVRTSTIMDLDERIEYALFDISSDSYQNLSSLRREEHKKRMETKRQEELSEQRWLEDQKYKNPFNIAFIKDRMRGWNMQELESKIQEYNQYRNHPQYKGNLTNIKEICNLLQQHKTDISNLYLQ